MNIVGLRPRRQFSFSGKVKAEEIEKHFVAEFKRAVNERLLSDGLGTEMPDSASIRCDWSGDNLEIQANWSED